MEKLDLVVIGTGGAAMAAGIHARAEGRTVVLVERGVIGGTCLNVGCVPSKTLLGSASTPCTTRFRVCRPAPGGST